MERFATDSLNKMAEEISGVADDIESALDVRTDFGRRYRRILVCGMGASAIGGRIFADSMYYESSVPVDCAKTMDLPKWVDGDTLFIACSYSGNTYETLSMYEKAVKGGVDTIAITHGGRLLEMAERDGVPIARIGGVQMQPRSAIGWFIGLVGGIVEDAGGPAVRDELREMLPRLRGYQKEFEDPDGFAWRLSRRIVGRIPAVYGVPDMEAAAVRLKNQLNENSKMIAFSGTMPEFNHNEIVGWYDDRFRAQVLPIVIIDRDLKEIDKIAKATVDLLESRDVDTEVVWTKGRTLLEKIVYAIMLGDHVSLYIAAEKGIDPCNVDPIVDIKSRIEKKLDNRPLGFENWNLAHRLVIRRRPRLGRIAEESPEGCSS